MKRQGGTTGKLESVKRNGRGNPWDNGKNRQSSLEGERWMGGKPAANGGCGYVRGGKCLGIGAANLAEYKRGQTHAVRERSMSSNDNFDQTGIPGGVTDKPREGRRGKGKGTYAGPLWGVGKKLRGREEVWGPLGSQVHAGGRNGDETKIEIWSCKKL